MTENMAIEIHIEENLHRIGVIEEFLRTNSEACDKECTKNIQILTKVNRALQEIQQYHAIGTVEECREAREKQMTKQPIILCKQSTKSEGQLFTVNYLKCPTCGNAFTYFGGIPNNCHKCGQTLKIWVWQTKLKFTGGFWDNHD